MRWSLAEKSRTGTDAVVVPAFTDRPGQVPSAGFVAACGFTGRPGEVLRLPGEAGGPAQVLLGFGAGATLDDDTVRSAVAELARAVSGFGRLGLPLPAPGGRAPGPSAVRAAVEGFLLGGYRFTRHKSAASGSCGPDHVDLLLPGGGGAAERTALDEGQRLAAATLLARDLVNEPGQDLTPALFAEQAAKVAADSGLRCEVWDEERIAAERLGGLLAVGRGSLRPPRLVRLTYRPDRPVGRYALIGKGVTFDAGGLSLKPSAEMLTMKADMAGAAAVLGAMSVLTGLGCGTQVDAWLPLTENMPNGDPVRIGDVLRMRGGRTVEVRNADAEGRLILADALTLAGECAPDAMIDVATLTDAAPIALGRKIAAVMGTDDVLVDRIRQAAGRAGEPVWPLPLSDRYRWQLESPVADLVNYTIGNRHGTALLAGLFLREFVPAGVPWAHLDIQGTALCDAEDGEWVHGATGFGVRTLAALVREPPAT
ncbi:leucyl aminopeptidase [Streptomyces sp. So13.3]|uniref:leucyl aminopeptidase n=1 Tax=Streptomyces sp. So13.3 TaxID=2136173 RepID=UPI001107473F|nr:leucyl aminopeptidase [Streptomyces sp. So13.3]QNA77279.1 leucyl aminopeptidase [Streptomyces sp. So13.3]